MHTVEYPLVGASLRERGSHDALESLESSVVSLELGRLKAQVPAARESIGRHRWEQIVTPPADVVRSSQRDPRTVASRAYHKLHDMLRTCAIPPPRRSVHLCEAPGGFVQATEDVAPADWRWMALSLGAGAVPRPAAALLASERGRFIEADVFDVNSCMSHLDGSADLVTADGAIEMQHADLEREHLPLLLAQTRLVVRALRTGGDAIVKFFEAGQRDTLKWIAWMSRAFTSVSVIKPHGSRPTNSERYLVARGFESEPLPLDLDQFLVAVLWLKETRDALEDITRYQKKSLRVALDRTRELGDVRASFSRQLGVPAQEVASYRCPGTGASTSGR